LNNWFQTRNFYKLTPFKISSKVNFDYHKFYAEFLKHFFTLLDDSFDCFQRCGLFQHGWIYNHLCSRIDYPHHRPESWSSHMHLESSSRSHLQVIPFHSINPFLLNWLN
jgi:hypothetical protein